MKRLICGLILFLFAAAVSYSAPVKKRHTLWTNEELDKVRGTQTYEAVSEDVIKYVALSDEKLWEIIPPITYARMYYVNQIKGCPIHGPGKTAYSWKIDPIDHPYQTQCSIGKEWYPNKNFPDDGTGWAAPDGEKYYFIGYYVHQTYLKILNNKLYDFAEAYIKTGQKEFAHKASVLLVRLAEQTPNATTKKDFCFGNRKGQFHKYMISSYGPKSGLFSDYVNDNASMINIAKAYEMVFDSIDNNQEFVDFIKTKIPELDTGAKVREYIEDELLKVFAKAAIDEVLHGNPGDTEHAGVVMAVVLDDYSDKYPNSQDLVDWLYNGWIGFRYGFSNMLYRDGGGMESPSYNKRFLKTLPSLYSLERYRKITPDRLSTEFYPNLLNHPKLEKMLDFHIDIYLQSIAAPAIGDSGVYPVTVFDGKYFPYNLNAVWNNSYSEPYDIAFKIFGKPEYARAIVLEDNSLRWQDPVLHTDSEKIIKAANSVGSHIPFKTKILDGYGLAMLQGGPVKFPRSLWIYYGEGRVHHHIDPLNLGLFAYNRKLIADLGYPLSYSLPYRSWETDIWTHNTVIVDDGFPTSPGNWGITHTPKGRIEYVQDLRNPETGLGVQLIRISVPQGRVSQKPDAPKIEKYCRTAALVDVSEENFYVVDLFEVTGGSEHHLANKIPEGKIEVSGINLKDCSGTFAGEAIGYAGKTIDFGRKVANEPATPGYDPRSCMEKVRRGRAENPYSFTWTANDDPDMHMRIIHLPEENTEAILTEGRPPANPDTYKITLDYARRKGDSPLQSRFVTIIEAYHETPSIIKAERIKTDENGVTVRIETTKGIDVLEINSNGEFTFSRKNKDNKNQITFKQSKLETKIANLNRKNQTITIELFDNLSLVDQWIQIGNESRKSTYQVISQKQDAEGRTMLELDTTSYLAEGVVTGVGDYLVKNDITIPLGGLEEDKVVGTELIGSYIENETSSYRVANVDYGNYYYKMDNWNVHIDTNKHPKATAEVLAKDFKTGSHFQICDYSIGDTVTIINVERFE